MLHWALNWVAMRQLLRCRKMLNTNPVSQLCILTDFQEVISYLHCCKGTISFCRMVILLICSTSGIAGCPERNSFVSQYHIIFNIPLEVPNLSSSCKKLTPVSNSMYVNAPLNSLCSLTFEKKTPLISEDFAGLSLLFCMLDTFAHRITELLRLEGTSGGHLVRPLRSSRVTTAGCSCPCPLGF